jgi:sarcosine oxidase
MRVFRTYERTSSVVQDDRALGFGRVSGLMTQSGREIVARQFVFCCGPWMCGLFQNLLGGRIFVTRQEVFFFGTPALDTQFSPPAMPDWICLADQMYGMLDLESRGFKIACDRHGPPFDPDCGERRASEEGLATAREYLARRFPATDSSMDLPWANMSREG